MIGRHLAYARYVIRHKWFVLGACLKLKAGLWRGLVHDLSKLTPAEWGPYARTFYSPRGEKQYNPDPFFDAAWLHHKNHNRHHHNHWVMVLKTDDEPIEMPEIFVREMVADWVGTGQAKGFPDTLAWYASNKDNMILHPNTRALVEKLLEGLK